jgi:hypothetical protein
MPGAHIKKKIQYIHVSCWAKCLLSIKKSMTRISKSSLRPDLYLFYLYMLRHFADSLTNNPVIIPPNVSKPDSLHRLALMSTADVCRPPYFQQNRGTPCASLAPPPCQSIIHGHEIHLSRFWAPFKCFPSNYSGDDTMF